MSLKSGHHAPVTTQIYQEQSNKSVFGCHHGQIKDARLERMQASGRFHNGIFHNISKVSPGLKSGTALPTLGEYFFGKQARNPPKSLPLFDPIPVWEKEALAQDIPIRVTWLGHSTLLLEIDGYRILTDPVWGKRVSPVSFAGPKRFHAPPAALQALPPLDAVIISHDHYDHLDYPTVLELAKRDVPFYTSLGVGAHLESWGIPATRIFELDWWETLEVLPKNQQKHPLRITAAPSQHFSGRGLNDRNRTAWSSFLVRSDKHSIFFSGDTGLTDSYLEIKERLGPFDLVMLEVGAWHPSWGDIHLGPMNALKAHQMLGSGRFLPVHWGTFNLALHAWDEPAETLYANAPAFGTHLVMPKLGMPIDILRTEPLTERDLWWRYL